MVELRRNACTALRRAALTVLMIGLVAGMAWAATPVDPSGSSTDTYRLTPDNPPPDPYDVEHDPDSTPPKVFDPTGDGQWLYQTAVGVYEGDRTGYFPDKVRITFYDDDTYTKEIKHNGTWSTTETGTWAPN